MFVCTIYIDMFLSRFSLAGFAPLQFLVALPVHLPSVPVAPLLALQSHPFAQWLEGALNPLPVLLHHLRPHEVDKQRHTWHLLQHCSNRIPTSPNQWFLNPTASNCFNLPISQEYIPCGRHLALPCQSLAQLRSPDGCDVDVSTQVSDASHRASISAEPCSARPRMWLKELAKVGRKYTF